MAAASLKRPLAAAGSDPGRERENNEDRVLCDPERGIYAVVDGVGGESGRRDRGADGGRDPPGPPLPADHRRLPPDPRGDRPRQQADLGEGAGQPRPRRHGLRADRRGGRRRPGDHRPRRRQPALPVAAAGEISKITRDHSPVGSREDTGEISEAEAMSHPRRNEIFRDVGSAPHEPDEEGFIDITQIRFEPDAALLICSDGLSDLVTSQAILSLVEGNAANPKAAVQALIDAANQAGGKDNVSVVLVEGERFAAAAASRSRKEPATAASHPASGTGVRGAGVARRGGGSRSSLLGAFVSRPAFLFYGALLGAFAFAAFGQGLASFRPRAAAGPRQRAAGGRRRRRDRHDHRSPGAGRAGADGGGGARRLPRGAPAPFRRLPGEPGPARGADPAAAGERRAGGHRPGGRRGPHRRLPDRRGRPGAAPGRAPPRRFGRRGGRRRDLGRADGGDRPRRRRPLRRSATATSTTTRAAACSSRRARRRGCNPT